MQITPTKRMLDYLRLIFYILILILLLTVDLVPLKTQSICFWYNTAHILCPSCGGTRSFLHFVSGDLQVAFTYHPLFTTSIYPIGLVLVIQDTLAILMNTLLGKKIPSLLLYFLSLFSWRS